METSLHSISHASKFSERNRMSGGEENHQFVAHGILLTSMYRFGLLPAKIGFSFLRKQNTGFPTRKSNVGRRQPQHPQGNATPAKMPPFKYANKTNQRKVSYISMATFRWSGDSHDKWHDPWSEDCKFDFAVMRNRRNETAGKQKQSGAEYSRLCVAVG